mmetsp:Transcript_5025/g.9140  ORF Transcript_5025/g.9140 Transcript_5025/m.9140 type:complete len:500 (+) Transcript_5025:86-1585(+)
MQVKVGAVRTPEETVSRVRSLLKCVSSRGLFAKDLFGRDSRSNAGNTPKQAEKWKVLFNKYDKDGSGELDFAEINKMVRQDLKLAERTVSDWDMKQLFHAIDLNRNGTVDFKEWLMFVQQGKLENRSDEEILKEVGRAVRLALRRNHIRVSEVESFFNSYDDGREVDMSEVTLGPRDMRHFFRSALKVSKHECSDWNLLVAFRVLDADGSQSLDGVEFMDFIRGWTKDSDPSSLSYRSLQGRSPQRSEFRIYHHRSSSAPAVSVPFSYCGRHKIPHSRACVANTKMGQNFLNPPPSPPGLADSDGKEAAVRHKSEVRPSTAPGAFQSIASPTFDVSTSSKPPGQGTDTAMPSPTAPPQLPMLSPLSPGRSSTLSPTASAPNSPHGHQAPGLRRASTMVWAQPVGAKQFVQDAAPVAQAHEPKKLSRPSSAASVSTAGGTRPSSQSSSRSQAQRRFMVPGTSNNRYSVISGSETLNRVENMLFEAGVDVRGQFHKSGRAS